MPSNPRKNKSRAILDHHTRRLAEQACEHVLETWELPGASGSQPKCGGHGGDDHACAPAPDLATAHVTGFVADLALRGLGPLVTSEHAPPPSQQPTQWQCIGADGDASDKVEQLAAASAMANPLRSATAEVLERKCEYTRENVRGKWLELRRASGFDAPLPLEWPSHNDGGHRHSPQ